MSDDNATGCVKCSTSELVCIIYDHLSPIYRLLIMDVHLTGYLTPARQTQ